MKPIEPGCLALLCPLCAEAITRITLAGGKYTEKHVGETRTVRSLDDVDADGRFCRHPQWWVSEHSVVPECGLLRIDGHEETVDDVMDYLEEYIHADHT